ncbi:2'-5' RNA ligase family protein [Mesorhizobium sp. LHD-90]|uniref:2'-5' RNA ligase family protein n=1 Tax=Mesorhizobium sp. LHD-90 TaxID=3071414 RepID=UPI0027DF8E38|nr:2'-5' RNA ligase family protein [Mesorhizobium sp. LHD-90]MDQ6434295.1 2'-5' RNA ligase family protein [Mesorhizobium sp. LHD-90]
MFRQGEFEFMAGQPPRPQYRERLFLGVFPDEVTANAIGRFSGRFSTEIGLTGERLKALRLHTSLIHVSDRKRLRSPDRFAAELAANAVSIPAFELTFGRMGSFRGMQKKDRPLRHPLVLLADDGPIRGLYDLLGSGLRKYQFRVTEEFRPHLTLSYNEQFVPTRAIAPIAFQVTEFALIHSELWLTKYNILRTWTLQ